MSVDEIKQVINNVEYKGWRFETENLIEDYGLLVKPVFRSNNHNDKGYFEEVAGRKWFLSTDMSESEIVKTLWLAVTVADEHERRKSFTYKGYRVFDPTININDLEEVAPVSHHSKLQDIDH